MIIDRIENHTLYPFGKAWKAAFDFLKTVTPETENKKHIIQGGELYAAVASYETKSRDTAKLETHRKYADIQVLISGSEEIECFYANGLTVAVPYDPEKDAEFYQIPEESAVQITLQPGQFAVFFPEDAHMPCLMSGNTPQQVKKVVIKVEVGLLKQL